MIETRLAVPDVSCERCERAIESAVLPLDGVARVTVDLPGKVVTVAHDPQVARVERLVVAIEEQGYAVAGRDDEPVTAA